MTALSLAELADINRFVDMIARHERMRLHFTRASETDHERELSDRVHASGLISLIPDEDAIRDRERQNMRADLCASYASRHRAGETFPAWLARMPVSEYRPVDTASLFPELVTRCGECGCTDDPTLSADRAASPHARYCPVRSAAA